VDYLKKKKLLRCKEIKATSVTMKSLLGLQLMLSSTSIDPLPHLHPHFYYLHYGQWLLLPSCLTHYTTLHTLHFHYFTLLLSFLSLTTSLSPFLSHFSSFLTSFLSFLTYTRSWALENAVKYSLDTHLC